MFYSLIIISVLTSIDDQSASLKLLRGRNSDPTLVLRHHDNLWLYLLCTLPILLLIMVMMLEFLIDYINMNGGNF